MSVAIGLHSFKKFKTICWCNVKIPLVNWLLSYIKNSVTNFKNNVAKCSIFIEKFDHCFYVSGTTSAVVYLTEIRNRVVFDK